MSDEQKQPLKRTGIFANMQDKPADSSSGSAEQPESGAGGSNVFGMNKEKWGQIASQGAEVFSSKKKDDEVHTQDTSKSGDTK